MPIVRAMTVFQGASGLPEDRFVNTWHFDSAVSLDATADLLLTRLGGFWNTPRAGAANGLAGFTSEYVNRAAQLKCYSLDDPEPRVPEERDFTLNAVDTSTNSYNLPEECAVVMSLHAAPPITGRRRGRLYLGPLHSNAVSDATTGSPVRVSAVFQAVIAAAAEEVMDGNVEGPAWVIWSPTNGTGSTVAGGFIDNALDTQRRRGPDPTSRLIFPAEV